MSGIEPTKPITATIVTNTKGSFPVTATAELVQPPIIDPGILADTSCVIGVPFNTAASPPTTDSNQNIRVTTGGSNYRIRIIPTTANATTNRIAQASNQTSEQPFCASLHKLPDNDYIIELFKPVVDMNDGKIGTACLATTFTTPSIILTSTIGINSVTVPLIACAACTNFANFSNSCPSNEEGSATQPQILAKQTKGCLVLPVLFKLLYDGTQSAAEEAHKCWLHCCLFP